MEVPIQSTFTSSHSFKDEAGPIRTRSLETTARSHPRNSHIPISSNLSTQLNFPQAEEAGLYNPPSILEYSVMELQGTGSSRHSQLFGSIIRLRKPKSLFLSKTKSNSCKMDKIHRKLGFDHLELVEAKGLTVVL